MTTQERTDKIIELRLANMSYKDIANKMGVATQVVYQTLFKAGLTKPGGARKGGGRLTPEVRQRIVDLKNEGHVYLEIASRVGVSGQVVYKVLKQAGLTNPRQGKPDDPEQGLDYDPETGEPLRG